MLFFNLLFLFSTVTYATTLEPVDATELKIKMEQEKPKWVWLHFWSTWCAPCVEEFPQLLKTIHALPQKKVATYLVSMDFPSEEKKVEAFLKEQKVHFTTYLRRGADEAFINDLESRWSGVLPTSILIDPKGKVVYLWQGETKLSIISRAILDRLKEVP